jgi:hypothetical protein
MRAGFFQLEIKILGQFRAPDVYQIKMAHFRAAAKIWGKPLNYNGAGPRRTRTFDQGIINTTPVGLLDGEIVPQGLPPVTPLILARLLVALVYIRP